MFFVEKFGFKGRILTCGERGVAVCNFSFFEWRACLFRTSYLSCGQVVLCIACIVDTIADIRADRHSSASLDSGVCYKIPKGSWTTQGAAFVPFDRCFRVRYDRCTSVGGRGASVQGKHT